MSATLQNENPECDEYGSHRGLDDLNIKRTTCQCIVLIYFNTEANTFGKFRNTMIANNPVMRAYGNGQFIGLAKDICCVEGVFPRNENIGILMFDHRDEAIKCIDSKVELREAHIYGGKELFIVPLCTPAQSYPGYRYIAIDIYEPKNATVFSNYIGELVNLVKRHGGNVIAGSTQTGQILGLRKHTFMFIVQWRSRESFFACNAEVDALYRPVAPPRPPPSPSILTNTSECPRAVREANQCRCIHLDKHDSVTPIQRDSGATCTSRIIFEIDSQHFDWC